MGELKRGREEMYWSLKAIRKSFSPAGSEAAKIKTGFQGTHECVSALCHTQPPSSASQTAALLLCCREDPGSPRDVAIRYELLAAWLMEVDECVIGQLRMDSASPSH